MIVRLYDSNGNHLETTRAVVFDSKLAHKVAREQSEGGKVALIMMDISFEIVAIYFNGNLLRTWV